ncbi:MAG: PEGA domain-containing protein [Candidatus Zhuqueibacterota bacterium]
MLSIRVSVFVGMIFLTLFNWGCSKAPLPTNPEEDDVKPGEVFGKLVIAAADKNGEKVDSAEVFVNSQFMGYTPFSKEDVQVGRCAVRVQKSGYGLYSESVAVEADKLVFLEALLEKIPMNMGQLLITVNEDSAVTYLTNNRSEILDLFYEREKAYVLEPGGYFLKSEKPGFKMVYLAVEVGVDIVVVKNLQLEKVKDPALPELVLTAPDSAQVGRPLLISWETNNADGIDIDYIENPGLCGKREIAFQSEGIRYIKATARNEAGQVSAVDSVYIFNPVAEPAKAPTVSVWLQPDHVMVHETAVIHWSSANATDVTVDYVPNAGLTGQWQVSFDAPGTYVIRAQAEGPGGARSADDTLTVYAATLPSLEFTVSPHEVAFGEPVQLSWSSDGAQVIIDHGVGVRGPFGNEEIVCANPGMKVFTATAYSEFGTKSIVTDSVLVNEPEMPERPSISLMVVDSAKVGAPVKIEWHSINATMVDVDYVQHPGLNGKTEVIFQSAGERVITATAYNAVGQTTVAETLIVAAEEVGVQVEPLFIPVVKKVCAVHPTIPKSIENAGQVTVVQEGYYRLKAEVWYNSGDSQKNESFFIRLKDATGTVYPQEANAGQDLVVPDDPGAPHLALREAGTFYLNQGEVLLGLYHYHTISNQFPQFINNGPITGAESVELMSVTAEFVGQ